MADVAEDVAMNDENVVDVEEGNVGDTAKARGAT